MTKAFVMTLDWVLAEEAKSDLRSIHQYIARDNPHAAKRLIEDIFRSIHTLAENPDLGRVREDLTDKPVKIFPAKHFIIVYHTDPSLRIARILDGRRNIAAII